MVLRSRLALAVAVCQGGGGTRGHRRAARAVYSKTFLGTWAEFLMARAAAHLGGTPARPPTAPVARRFDMAYWDDQNPGRVLYPTGASRVPVALGSAAVENAMRMGADRSLRFNVDTRSKPVMDALVSEGHLETMDSVLRLAQSRHILAVREGMEHEMSRGPL